MHIFFVKSTNFWGANNPGVPWLPACHGCCFFKKKLGGYKTPGLPKEITSNSKWFWRCPKSWDTQRVSHISWSIHLFGGKKRTPSPYSLRRNLPSWLKSPKKKLANMLARCSSSFHPPPCNQQNIASKCQFFDAPLPLCPPGNSVYFPHCTGCVKPRWATCASDDIILKKKNTSGSKIDKTPTWTGEQRRKVSRTTMSMYFNFLLPKNRPQQKIFATKIGHPTPEVIPFWYSVHITLKDLGIFFQHPNVLKTTKWQFQRFNPPQLWDQPVVTQQRLSSDEAMLGV